MYFIAKTMSRLGPNGRRDLNFVGEGRAFHAPYPLLALVLLIFARVRFHGARYLSLVRPEIADKARHVRLRALIHELPQRL